VKISGGGSIKPASPTSTQEVVSGKQPAPQGAVSSSRGDKVELSEGSSLLQRVEEALNNVSVVDAARVEEVKQAISENDKEAEGGAAQCARDGRAHQRLADH